MIKLYESFAQSRNNIIRRYFDDLQIDLNKWFTEGSLSQNTNLLEIEESNLTQGTSRSIICDFEDDEYRYQLMFFIDQGMFEEEKLTKLVLTLKRYDTDSKLIDNYEDEVQITDITEDFIVDKITNIDEIGRFKAEPSNGEESTSSEFAEEATAEETPTEEVPVEETQPAKETPAEETPAA
jgi:hypothetical protein